MPASKKEKREKGKSYGESIAHNHKECPEKSNEQVKYSRRKSDVEFCFQELAETIFLETAAAKLEPRPYRARRALSALNPDFKLRPSDQNHPLFPQRSLDFQMVFRASCCPTLASTGSFSFRRSARWRATNVHALTSLS